MANRASLAVALALASLSCGSAGSQPRPDDAMIVPYLAIASALSSDSTDGVASLADEVKKGATVKSEAPGVAKILAAVDGLHSTDIAKTRRSFKNVSDGMVEYMRSASGTQPGRVTIFCPMAFENRGALWVQDDGKIENPYHGLEMRRCGNKLAWDAELPETAKLD